jgi:hypothetical protein
VAGIQPQALERSCELFTVPIALECDPVKETGKGWARGVSNSPLIGKYLLFTSQVHCFSCEKASARDVEVNNPAG